MVSRRQRADWQQRAEEVEVLCADRNLKLWEKTHRVASVYKGVDLDGLKSKHRRRLFDDLARVNAILGQYPIETFDDYRLIVDHDLRNIIEIFRGFSRFAP